MCQPRRGASYLPATTSHCRDPHPNREPREALAGRPPRPKASGYHYRGALPHRRLLLGEFLFYSGLINWDSLIKAIVWQRRQRTTFQPLMSKGLRDKESDTVKRILTDPKIVEREYVRENWLREALKTPYEPSPEWSFLWSCISLELWLKRFWA